MFWTILLCAAACRPSRGEPPPMTEASLEAIGYRELVADYPTAWPLPARPPTLSWAMAVQGERLIVHYRVENPGDQPIWLFDRPASAIAGPQGPAFVSAPREGFVRNGREPGSALLFRGFLGVGDCMMLVSSLAATRVEAEGGADGSFEVPFPLRTEYPRNARATLLEGVHAVGLEIGWTIVDPATLDVPTLDGAPLLDGSAGYTLQRWLAGPPLPLPVSD